MKDCADLLLHLFSHLDLAPVEEVLDTMFHFLFVKPFSPINPTVAFGQFRKCQDCQNAKCGKKTA